VATPECHGPSELIAASSGIDRLLADATEATDCCDAKLLKNCIDSVGNYYGAQENYEVDAYAPHEHDSWARKIGALKIVTYMTIGVMFGLGSVLLATVALLVFRPATVVPTLMLIALVARVESVRGAFILWYFRLALIPKFVCVSLFYRSTRMGRTYKALSPFLVSRTILAGSGGLDRRGKFFLGQKAASRNSDWFTGCDGAQRSIFCINQVFKDLLRSVADKSNHSLYQCRQRLSIGIGDSNMCQESEYLRVATTTLVLDAIEAGAIADVPRLKGTIRGLRKINWDPELRTKVMTTHGKMSAIEIQRFYVSACKRYIDSIDQPPQEAYDILSRWTDVLNRLEDDPESLFGRIDWITKRAMMRHAVESLDGSETGSPDFGTTNEFRSFSNVASLRKIDVKYHEVSGEGYYYRLLAEALTQPVLADNVVERAERMPPLSNPAAQRCRYIREFTDEIEWVRWDAIKLMNKEEEILFSRDQ